ncbi:MAG: hypothetical protein ACK5P7_04955, partial [Bdellovibrio sp.]
MNRNLVCLFLCLVLTGLAKVAAAAVDPKIDWKTARSAHFNLIYDARQQELAAYYLVRMERAWSQLQTVWKVLPERLTVILNDRTDLTNGYATALPYAHVMLFPALPGPMESISELGDWAENISVHEFTHILSMEQRRGAVKFLSHIFGNIVTPNLLLPRWWLEGVAVDAETRFSTQGRLRSNFQDATLRALADSKRWSEFDLAEINESDIPTWPYGARPYIFGSLLWSEMIALEGEEMISDLHVAFGGRLPYMLSDPIEERFKGQDLTALFARTKASVQTRVQTQKQTLSKVPMTTAEPFVDPDFVEMFTPRLSPDGLKLAFLAKTDVLKRSIQILVRPKPEDMFLPEHRVRTFGQRKEEVTTPGGDVKFPRLEHDAPPGGTINRISWKPDSKSFVFDLITEKDIFHDVSDLWTFSLAEGKGKQLTKGLRAREPEVSPDGAKVAFVRLEAGRTMLAIYDFTTQKAQELYRPALMSRVAWPVWLSNQRVLFSLRDKNGEQLMVYDLTTQKVEAVPLTLGEVTLPVVRGNHVFFVSNKNGVRNVYRTDLLFKNPVAVTHLWTGAYASDWDASRQELWVTQIGERGLELVRIPEKNFVASLASLPRIEPLFSDRYPLGKPELKLAPTDGALSQTEDYSPLPYLIPRYWLPFVYFDDKGTQMSASTSAFDPLQKHAYSLFGSYDTATQKGSYALGYVNQSLSPTILMQTSKLSSYLADPDQKTTAEGSQVGMVSQLSNIDPDLFLTYGWSWLSREQFGVKTY